MEWLTYLLKVTACTVLFFGFYLLVLRKLTFFKINRFYLLITLVLSFVIPALQFELTREAEMVPVKIIDQPEIKFNEVAPLQFSQPLQVDYPQQEPAINWFALLPYGYAIISLVLLFVCIWKLLVLLKNTRNYTQNDDGLKLVTKASGFTNCSFFNYVFIDANCLSAPDLRVLLKHEQVHARQYHSVDKLILMVFKSILWFNPIIYLYDKALEQVHEYEADEITSTDFGNQAYASLLLKLAITKSDMPLIHNFVKSPIKARIKMLFHAKSKNMKKLRYLFSLPVAIGLIWLFAIQVVYAQNNLPATTEVKQPLQKSETVKGKIIRIEPSLVGEVFALNHQDKTYLIVASGFYNKIKVGDDVVVHLSGKIENFTKKDKNGKVIASLQQPVWMPLQVSKEDGTLIYKQKTERHAFLYEANKARSATSKIKAIQKNGSDKIEKIVLNDGFFTININLAAQNIKDSSFKIGDAVLVKFIGEKLTSKHTYTTDKMIVLYSEPKKYIIKNEALYNRFYFNDGKQKVALVKSGSISVVDTIKPKIISFTRMTGNVNSGVFYMENAVIEINGNILKARKVEWNKNTNTITARGAFLDKYGNIEMGDKMIFNLANKSRITFPPGEGYFNMPADAVKDIKYKADTVLLNKDKTVTTLIGNASIWSDYLGIYNGSKIIYNSSDNTVNIINADRYSKKIRRGFRADSIKVDLKAGKSLEYGSEAYQL